MTAAREPWSRERRRALALVVLMFAAPAIVLGWLAYRVAAPRPPIGEPQPLRLAIRAIDSGEWLGTRQAALRDVAAHGAEAKKYVPRLIEVMQHHRDDTVRAEVPGALIAIAPGSIDVAVALLEAACSGDRAVGGPACSQLDRLEPHPTGFQRLLQFVSDDSPTEVVRTALRLLVNARPRPAALAEALTERLERLTATRSEIAAALGSLGPDAREAVPELTRLAKEGAPRERVAAAGALDAITSDPTALRGVTAALAEPEQWRRMVGCERAALVAELGRHAEVGREWTALVGGALDDPETCVRHAAARALLTLGERRERAIMVLAHDVRSDDHTLAQGAVASLRGIAARAPELEVDLAFTATRRNREGSARMGALQELAELGPRRPATIEALIRLTLEEASTYSALATTALAEAQPPDTATRERIHRALIDAERSLAILHDEGSRATLARKRFEARSS